MSAASTILHPPTFKFSPNSNTSVFFPIRSHKSISRSGLEFEKPGFWLRRTMIKTVVLGNARNGDKGIEVLEQEAFVKRSPEFRDLESTVNRLSKWVVAGLFGGLILWRHDAEVMWVAMGSIVNAILSVGLKRVLNQERPVVGLRLDPGMPSSHAQSIFFLVAFAVMSIVEWLGVNKLSLSLSFLALLLGSYLSWLRVSQRLHTFNQVLVGAVLGSAFSILWHLSWNGIVLEAFLSSLWVRLIVILAAVGFCLGFAFYVIKNWFTDER